MINLESIDVEVPSFKVEPFVFWINSVVEEEGYGVGEITFVFCSDDYLLEMNRKHLDHDYYTDIITFDYVEGDVVSGDLFISLDRIGDNASLLNVQYEEELLRVCVHGVLHLCGYQDKSDDEERVMRRKEDYYLSKIVPRETLEK